MSWSCMARSLSFSFFSFLFALTLLSQACHSLTPTKKTYIVHMKHHLKPSRYSTHHEWYASHLQSLSLHPSRSLLYTYTTAYHGFAASLDPEEAESLRKVDTVLGVYEERVYTLHTTRTPEFLGISQDLGLSDQHGNQDEKRTVYSDVIIGVLDTGVWPESKSFDDFGMPDVPPRWRGECESGSDFDPKVCNKKLIGARAFSQGYNMAKGGGSEKKPKETGSPRDDDGHGTHTASTAAGSRVSNASLFGYASGMARGMAIHARVATYKVCWSTGCFGSDILAGMDRALTDGVDILSISLGGGPTSYHHDIIAIGAFAAVEKGVLVSCSAGNSGPTRASLANVAPWIMTVGAGTLDRDFPAYAVLGNKNRLTGVSLYSGPGLGNKPVGLVYAKGNNSSSSLCLPGSLDPNLVRGKVVLCDRGSNARVQKGVVVRDAGGVGMILANTASGGGEELVADSHLLPAVAVGRKMGDIIKEYVRSDANPTAVLSFGGTVLNVRPSPVVAAFSSRGPNLVTPEISKPDVIGPGVNILAAWSGAVGPTGLDADTRKTQFSVVSGTSMSCPHISGLAALLKAVHPNWSPSAIKSALMTTAYTRDNTNSPLRDANDGSLSTPWAHGSGHVDPQKSLSPGLVYDISPKDYIAFICSLGYTLDEVKTIVKRPNVTCSRKFSNPGQLNYPSFSVVFDNKRVVRYTRILTNVGAASSVYQVAVTGPWTVAVTVKPTKLVFSKVGERRRYTVTFVSKKGVTGTSDFGSIIWRNAQNQVKSPVAYAWTQIPRLKR